MAAIWQNGRRLFTLAAILMLLTAVAHTLGQFAPPEAGEVSVINAMRGYSIDLGLNMRPTIFDVFRALAFTMTVTFFGLGVLNLMIAAGTDVTPALIRRITWVNLIWLTGFTALCVFYQVLPPVIFGLLMMGILALSLVINRKS